MVAPAVQAGLDPRSFFSVIVLSIASDERRSLAEMLANRVRLASSMLSSPEAKRARLPPDDVWRGE